MNNTIFTGACVALVTPFNDDYSVNYKMLEELRKVCGLEKIRTFGNDPDSYDVCVRAAEGESILKALRREADPYFWQKTQN